MRSEPSSRQLWAIFQSATTFVIAVALVVALAVTGAFEHLSLLLLSAILFVQPLSVASSYFIAWRIRVLSGGTVEIKNAFKASALANTLLFVLPSRLSEFVKPIYFAEKSHIPLAAGIGIVVIERIIDIVIVAAGIVAVTLLVTGQNLGNVLPMWVGLATAAICAAAVILYRPQFVTSLLRLLPEGRLQDLAVTQFECMSTSVSPRSVPVASMLGLFAWLLSWATFHVFLMVAGARPVTPDCSLVVFLAGSLGLVTAIAPGGLGTFEGAIVIALGLYGYTVPEALAMAVGLHLATLGYQLPLAIWVGAREGMSLANIARKASDVVKQSWKINSDAAD